MRAVRNRAGSSSADPSAVQRPQIVCCLLRACAGHQSFQTLPRPLCNQDFNSECSISIINAKQQYAENFESRCLGIRLHNFEVAAMISVTFTRLASTFHQLTVSLLTTPLLETRDTFLMGRAIFQTPARPRPPPQQNTKSTSTVSYTRMQRLATSWGARGKNQSGLATAAAHHRDQLL